MTHVSALIVIDGKVYTKQIEYVTDHRLHMTFHLMPKGLLVEKIRGWYLMIMYTDKGIWKNIYRYPTSPASLRKHVMNSRHWTGKDEYCLIVKYTDNAMTDITIDDPVVTALESILGDEMREQLKIWKI